MYAVMAEAFACLSDPTQREMYDANRVAEIQPELRRRTEQVLEEVRAYIFLQVYKALFGPLGGTGTI